MWNKMAMSISNYYTRISPAELKARFKLMGFQPKFKNISGMHRKTASVTHKLCITMINYYYLSVWSGIKSTITVDIYWHIVPTLDNVMIV
jgi:hypothetical protein